MWWLVRTGVDVAVRSWEAFEGHVAVVSEGEAVRGNRRVGGTGKKFLNALGGGRWRRGS